MRQIKQQDEYVVLPADLAAHMASIGQAIAQRRKLEEYEKGKGQDHSPAPVIHLPPWPEAVRGAPNDILRSALFAAIQGKGRQHIENRLIASVNGTSIKYTGLQLEQSDLDVWEQVLHLARQNPLGTVCQFKGGTFLKAIGRSAGKKDYQWLDRVLSRLNACEVRIERCGYIQGRGLVTAHDADTKTRLYKVTIDPGMAKLYAAGWSAIDWQQRQALRRKPLALWLHGVLCDPCQTLERESGHLTKPFGKSRQDLAKLPAEASPCP